MNCKPNELAIVIIGDRFTDLHLGSIVRTIRPINLGYGIDWITDPVLYGTDGARIAWNDSHLRPIRPDETPEQSIEAMKLLHQLPKETV